MGNKASKLSHTNISDLPDELIYAIFRLIDVIQLLPLSRVCIRWRWLINDPRLRKVLDFGTEYRENFEPTLTRILCIAPLLHTLKTGALGVTVNSVIHILAETCPHLSVLELSYCHINEESWQLIGTVPWPRLTHLSLPGCGIDDRVLATILPALSTLTVLNITHNMNVTDGGILCITGHTPTLQCLLLDRMPELTCASTVPLLDAVGSHLTQLSLCYAKRTLLEALPTACVCLRVLALHCVRGTMDVVAGCLQRLTHLTHLRLRDVFTPGAHRLHGLFNAAPECPLKLEHLTVVCVPVDDHVLVDIARTYGSHLRFLSIKGNDVTITGVGLTEFASRCNALEHLELDFHRIADMDPVIIRAVSTMPHLRIFAVNGEDSKIKAIKEKLARILPNLLVGSKEDLYGRDEYKRWQLPDISCNPLQYGSLR